MSDTSRSRVSTSEEVLSEKQFSTLRHMLGINDPSKDKPVPYRNYAAVTTGDPEFAELERLGMVVNRGCPKWSEYDYFECTEDGKIAGVLSFWRVQKPRCKRRYLRFLEARDVFPDLTFHEFLTNPEYVEQMEVER